MLDQLEFPGLEANRAARNLRLLKQYQEFKMQQAVDGWTVARMARVERQDAALGWIRVAGVAVALLALALGLVAVALGDTQADVVVPLAIAFGGGASPQVLHQWLRSRRVANPAESDEPSAAPVP